MLKEEPQNPSPFQNKVRVRVCGILKQGKEILLLKHEGIGKAGHLWLPPGGGVEFGQSLEEALKREFLEETHLEVEVRDFLFTNEHIDHAHHALEFFFRVEQIGGHLKLGLDPELPASEQLLTEAKYFSAEELQKLDPATIHNSFHQAKSIDQIADLRGLLTFED